MHVIADTLTSALAIAALLAGRYLGWGWLDAVSGVVGGFVILQWGVGLARRAGQELLDVNPRPELEHDVRAALEAQPGVRVVDVHVWPLGGDALSCIVTLCGCTTLEVAPYRETLARFGFAHLTVELRAEDPAA
jgi:Co/Zn/Cd efflux system component